MVWGVICFFMKVFFCIWLVVWENWFFLGIVVIMWVDILLVFVEGVVIGVVVVCWVVEGFGVEVISVVWCFGK